ncbi:MAG: histidinol-phosphate transaminase [Gemmatimonadetes bacterium]|nr:histidinol-phosphate transaminase [Gemmatimonadota bacterium]
MSVRPRAATAVLPIYEPGRDAAAVARSTGRDDIVKLASNESPYGASPRVLEALRDAVDDVHLYPDAAGARLREALAARHGVEADWIVLGNGSVELIENTAKAFLDAGDEAVLARPSFLKFAIATRLMGARSIEIPTIDDQADLEAMAAAVGSRTKVVFLANPDNPTGRMVTAAELLEFIDGIPETVLLFLDQAYFEYVAEEAPSLRSRIERGNLVVSRTFSKAFGLAGLRIGYGVGHPELMRSIGRVREHFNTSSIAQVAALAALGDFDHVARTIRLNREQREFLARELSERGLRVTPSYTNFLLVRPPKEGPLARVGLAGALMEEGVIVRPMGFYGMPEAVRISVGTADENRRLVQALDRARGSRESAPLES